MATADVCAFRGAHDFTIHDVTLNHVQGNYIVNTPSARDERREILDFYTRLSNNFNHDPYYDTRHKHNVRKTFEGTCQWVFQHATFLQWRDGDPPETSVLWVHGPPGSGKSILSSQVIEGLKEAPTSPTLAYHFCDFSRQDKELDILSMIACQLLDVDAADIPPLPAPIVSASVLQLRRLDFVRSVVDHLIDHAPGRVYLFLDGLDEELSSTMRWNDGIGPVLKTFLGLAARRPQRVRVWVSSQHRREISDALANQPHIDLSRFARRDIMLFLSKSIPQIQGPEQKDHDTILHHLGADAETSFMWAALMVDEVKKLPSLSAIKDFLGTGFPSNLNEYYGHIFARYPQHLRPLASKVFSLVVFAKRPLRFCELWDAVWALSNKDKVVFSPDNKPFKEQLMEVFQPFVELVPTPGSHSPNLKNQEHQYTCRLIHSTLKDFLLNHPTILRQGCPSGAEPEVCICPETPFTACLAYLSQSRFATQLTKQNDQWVDFNGSPVMDSRFLIYAAKYWDKHLDGVRDPKRQAELLPLVVAFVKSPNFWTLTQVQSIWVEYQFIKLPVTVVCGTHQGPLTQLRRVFPVWFLHSDDGFNIWVQYRSFIRQWRYVLSLGEYGGESSDTQWSPSSCVGEMCHIWTQALGHDHFLRDRPSSVVSFPVSVSEATQVCHENAPCIFFTDLVDKSGEFLYTLRVHVANLPAVEKDEPLSLKRVISQGTLNCQVETWRLVDNTEPVLQIIQSDLDMPANAVDLDLYIADPTNPYTLRGRAAFAAFSSDGQIMRIGTRVLLRGGTGKFYCISELPAGPSRKSKYLEDVACHGRFLITTTRTKLSKKDLDGSLGSLYEDWESDEDGFDCSGAGGGEDEEDDDRDSIEGRVVCIGSEDEEVAYPVVDSDDDSNPLEYASEDDSISEDSSLFSDEDRFQDILDNAESPESDDYSDGDAYEHGGLSGERRYAGLIPDSDSSDSEDEQEAKGREGGKKPQCLDEEHGDDDWDELPRYFGEQQMRCHSKPRAVITIWNRDMSEEPVLIFKKEVPIQCKLYDSPPAFHPMKPLVVWPLGDGDILFIDYDSQRSFTLSLRSCTTSLPSRFISIRCVFSKCGLYVHIAALEGSRPDVREMGESTPLPPLCISLLLATYRLSKKKTTRSPPHMIHIVRVDLKDIKAIDTKQLPFNFTWTDDHLFVSASWKMLQVWRVHLFRHENQDGPQRNIQGDDEYDEDSQPVMAPKKVVFLPNTCKRRSVRFFPSTASLEASDKEPARSPATARLVVGCEASVLALPVEKPKAGEMLELQVLQGTFRPTLQFENPVVCYLDEEKHLGEWVDSKDRVKVTKGSGGGQLYRRMDGAEMFDLQDLCDLEPYYF